jgi:5-methylcytosine-specific restriction endonuclease McrA
MRTEILFMIATAAAVSYIYTEGRILRMAMAYKKYYQIGGVVIGAFLLYALMKRDPDSARDLIRSSGSYMNYLPLDSELRGFVEPLVDLSTRKTFQGDYNSSQPIVNVPTTKAPIIRGGESGQRFKRSVSEARKKYVAASQGWRCKICNQILSSTYQADHILPIHKGGSNEIENIRVICVFCHANLTQRDALGL